MLNLLLMEYLTPGDAAAFSKISSPLAVQGFWELPKLLGALLTAQTSDV